MNTHPMKRVTIVTESLAKEPLKGLLTRAGASGWTMFDVTGSGAQGERTGEIQEFSNIQIEVIVKPAVAEKLLEQLHREFFAHFAMVAYTCDVQVLRQSKF